MPNTIDMNDFTPGVRAVIGAKSLAATNVVSARFYGCKKDEATSSVIIEGTANQENTRYKCAAFVRKVGSGYAETEGGECIPVSLKSELFFECWSRTYDYIDNDDWLN